MWADDALTIGKINEEIDKNKIKIYDNREFYISGDINYGYCKYKYGEIIDSQINLSDNDDVIVAIEFVRKDDIIVIRKNVLIYNNKFCEEIPNCTNKDFIYEEVWELGNKLKITNKMYIEELLYKYNKNTIVPDRVYKKIQDVNILFKEKVNTIRNETTTVYVDKIVGTTHGNYSNCEDWYDIFIHLKRNDTLIKTIRNDNFKEIISKNEFKDKICVRQIDDEFFVDGEGNHRVTIAKFIGIEYIENCPITVKYKTNTVYKDLFDKIKDMGINVNVLEEDWKTFIVELKDKKELILYGKEEIESFIIEYKRYP